MGKDPALLWYPNDWLGGTMGMTLEQKGAYMELLMAQFNRGHMTIDMIGQLIGQNWDMIQDKFIQDEKGLWYNKRLEDEKNKRQSFVQSRINNKSGVNQHSKKRSHDQTYDHEVTSHMEDEDVNENEDKKISISYESIKSSFNEICKSYPKLTKLSDARKKAIHARFNSGYVVEDFTKLFEMAENSDFLKGKNQKNWSATFDWLICDSNMAKVLDGNYVNKGENVHGTGRDKQVCENIQSAAGSNSRDGTPLGIIIR